MKTHVLVVEDEEDMGEFLEESLTERGYRVHWVRSAESALVELSAATPDIVVLDIMMPGLSGFKLCELIKGETRTASLPIIMLTVLDQESQKVKGLNLGADDYITKPFSARELEARLEAVLRRARFKDGRQCLAAGNLSVDVAERAVTSAGRTVDLTVREYDLLVLFLQRKGKVLSREEIAKALLDEGQAITRHTLKTHVRNLRGKLGDAGRLIKSVHGVGYVLDENVSGAGDAPGKT